MQKTLKFSNLKLYDAFNVGKSVWSIAYENIVVSLKKNKNLLVGSGYVVYQHKKENKISVLLASHNMDEVKRLCNSVLMMKGGTIVDSGTPDNLIAKHGRKNLEDTFLKIARSKNELE